MGFLKPCQQGIGSLISGQEGCPQVRTQSSALKSSVKVVKPVVKKAPAKVPPKKAGDKQ